MRGSSVPNARRAEAGRSGGREAEPAGAQFSESAMGAGWAGAESRVGPSRCRDERCSAVDEADSRRPTFERRWVLIFAEVRGDGGILLIAPIIADIRAKPAPRLHDGNLDFVALPCRVDRSVAEFLAGVSSCNCFGVANELLHSQLCMFISTTDIPFGVATLNLAPENEPICRSWYSIGSGEKKISSI